MVPVPVAGDGGVTRGGVAALATLEFDEELVELDDDDELVDEGLSALCTAAVSAVLTRFKAVWLAMLARPVASVVDAPNMLSMTLALVACFEASD